MVDPQGGDVQELDLYVRAAEHAGGELGDAVHDLVGDKPATRGHAVPDRADDPLSDLGRHRGERDPGNDRIRPGAGSDSAVVDRGEGLRQVFGAAGVDAQPRVGAGLEVVDELGVDFDRQQGRFGRERLQDGPGSPARTRTELHHQVREFHAGGFDHAPLQPAGAGNDRSDTCRVAQEPQEERELAVPPPMTVFCGLHVHSMPFCHGIRRSMPCAARVWSNVLQHPSTRK